MTDETQKRLSGRINLLSDFQTTIDYENDMVYVHNNRKLDCSITWLKNMSKPQFSTYLNDVTEAYLTFNKL
jgi:hypothetical protein